MERSHRIITDGPTTGQNVVPNFGVGRYGGAVLVTNTGTCADLITLIKWLSFSLHLLSLLLLCFRSALNLCTIIVVHCYGNQHFGTLEP